MSEKPNFQFFMRGTKSYSSQSPLKWKSLSFKGGHNALTSRKSSKRFSTLTQNQKYAQRFNNKSIQNSPVLEKKVHSVLTYRPVVSKSMGKSFTQSGMLKKTLNPNDVEYRIKVNKLNLNLLTKIGGVKDEAGKLVKPKVHPSSSNKSIIKGLKQ
jgi:hypothetical protein